MITCGVVLSIYVNRVFQKVFLTSLFIPTNLLRYSYENMIRNCTRREISCYTVIIILGVVQVAFKVSKFQNILWFI